jgi:carbon starvation protein
VFITIACGAVSGFHALVSSGTTPKIISSEGDVRLVGYGSMALESLVAIMAIIAATLLDPGVYFAINTGAGIVGAAPEAAVHTITGWGFPVTVEQMQSLANDMGESSLFARTGGAPSLAVGMASIFGSSFGRGLLSIWYHFAIMFEALFILTTIDTGTRIARFLLQEALGKLHPQFEQTDWLPGAALATIVVTAGWGLLVATGSIETIWPMFGIANQLLAVIALSLVTTLLVNRGRAKYAWVTLAPMLFVTATTMTAGYQLIHRWSVTMLPYKATALTGILNIACSVFIIASVCTLLVIAASNWLTALRFGTACKEPVA